MATLWSILQPSNCLFLLLLAGLALLAARRRRAGIWLVSLSMAGFAAVLLLPIAGWLTFALESRFPQPVLPARIDGIIVLGGTTDTKASEHWGRPQLGESAERLTEAATLARRYPGALLVVSGGHRRPSDAFTEARLSRTVLADMDIPVDRAVFEERSVSTWENAAFSKDLVRPRPGQAWVLVTSAFHMPRAVGVFRALGWEVIPYPVDFQTQGPGALHGFSGMGRRLWDLDFIAREWTALGAYHLRGMTSAFLPR